MENLQKITSTMAVFDMSNIREDDDNRLTAAFCFAFSSLNLLDLGSLNCSFLNPAV